MNIPTIVVVQTSPGGRMICRIVLETILGLVDERDFVILSRPVPTQELFAPGKKQFFITGSFDGIDEGLPAQMVQRVRGYNPEVVAASFAVQDLQGDFDLHIKKLEGDPGRNFREVVESFLKGTLSRVQ